MLITSIYRMQLCWCSDMTHFRTAHPIKCVMISNHLNSTYSVTDNQMEAKEGV